MLNIFSKSKPWMVASLLVATSAFSQTDNRCAPKAAPCAPKPCAPCVKVCPAEPKLNLNPAYNASAAINTRCSWDVNVNASFIYWQAMQDNMELGFSTATSVATSAVNGLQGNVVNMDFNFKPGFKVGLGFATGHDDWDVQAEYTWFHGQNSRSTNGPGAPGYLIPSVNGIYTGDVANSISQKWRLNMDLIDLNLGRSYYVGTKLTMRPSLGARAAFIRQKASMTNDNNVVVAVGSTSQIEYNRAKTHSWGVGTAAGLETNWMIGDGFRLFGNGEADILFTRYTKVNQKASFGKVSAAVANPSTYLDSLSQKNINTMRTHLNIGSGIAYGTYFDCNNWYLDISAGYEFQVFFDQNMFRHFDGRDFNAISGFAPNGNLYVQGLTLKMELDF